MAGTKCTEILFRGSQAGAAGRTCGNPTKEALLGWEWLTVPTQSDLIHSWCRSSSHSSINAQPARDNQSIVDLPGTAVAEQHGWFTDALTVSPLISQAIAREGKGRDKNRCGFEKFPSVSVNHLVSKGLSAWKCVIRTGLKDWGRGPVIFVLRSQLTDFQSIFFLPGEPGRSFGIQGLVWYLFSWELQSETRPCWSIFLLLVSPTFPRPWCSYF